MKKVLLIASSLLPQVITETFYGLVCREQPFIPDEVHVIVTEEGLQCLRDNLWSEGRNIFAELCVDLGLNVADIRFDMSTIHLMHLSRVASLHGHKLGINHTCEDFVVSVVRQLVADEESIIHTSISGGRKNTGFYLGYAMSLFGREHDELSHVLIPVEFEFNSSFFYPSKQVRDILNHEGEIISTAKACITLVDIPFVRLRKGFPQNILQEGQSFSEVVHQAQEALEPAHVRVELKQRLLVCAGVEIPLSPCLLAWYACFADLRHKEEHQGLLRRDLTAKTYLFWLAKVQPTASGHYTRTEESLKDGIKTNYFLEKNTNIKKRLKACLHDAAEDYMIHATGTRPNTRYGLRLAASAIEIVEG